MIHIALINGSTFLDDRDVEAIVPALNTQIGHLGHAGYPIVAEVHHYRQVPPASAWQLVLLDDSDVADALGYHENTLSGRPLGKAFVGDATRAGLNWTVTVSHELVEMLVDQTASLVYDLGTNAAGESVGVAWEACDPVEADRDGYTIDGVQVSDFITPNWFLRGSPGPYDWARRLSKPLTLRPGGYASICHDGSWSQIRAQLGAPGETSRARFSHRWRRRAKRRAPDDVFETDGAGE